jgi:hypothetical protein
MPNKPKTPFPQICDRCNANFKTGGHLLTISKPFGDGIITEMIICDRCQKAIYQESWKYKDTVVTVTCTPIKATE